MYAAHYSGMGLCPFASHVRIHHDVHSDEAALRCAITRADGTDVLLQAVRKELTLLAPGIASVRAGTPTKGSMPQSSLLVCLPPADSTYLAEYRDFV